MIVLGTNKSIMRLKFLIILFLNFDLMIKNLTSWSKLSNINEHIWPHEQIEFRPHDRKFDLLKKLNFDLMKFNLMIIPHCVSSKIKQHKSVVMSAKRISCNAFENWSNDYGSFELVGMLSKTFLMMTGHLN